MYINEEQMQGLAEMECCTERYFGTQILPIMQSVKNTLIKEQSKELIEYSNSREGIISAIATPTGCINQGLIQIKMTGEWNSKTSEDYLAMCREKMENSGNMNGDLKILADEWQKQITRATGEEQYAEMCKALGRDVGEAYLEFRIEQLMIDQLVKEEMPKSAIEYIVKKATDNSLFGISSQINKSPLEQSISDRAEKAYSPNKMEKAAGNLLGFGIDTMATGGMGSWSRLGAMAAIDAGANMIIDSDNKDIDTIEQTEKNISKGVFGREDNILAELKEKGKNIIPHENEYIKGINEKMEGRMSLIPEERLEWMRKNFSKHEWRNNMKKSDKITEDMPYIIRPGKEEEYLKEKKTAEYETNAPKTEPKTESNDLPMEILDEEVRKEDKEESIYSWNGLLKSTGTDGIGNIGNNLGYVIAMLPDMIGRVITGKTNSLKIADNLLPIASIICGMFVRNPLLRMLLVAGGGINLMNKVGKEALGERKENAVNQPVSYKKYAEEVLDKRIDNPQIKGNYLLLTVDRIPCSVRLPPQTADAYHKGALPLNTLANAVLRKSDELQSMAMENYERSEQENRNKGLTLG